MGKKRRWLTLIKERKRNNYYLSITIVAFLPDPSNYKLNLDYNSWKISDKMITETTFFLDRAS